MATDATKPKLPQSSSKLEPEGARDKDKKCNCLKVGCA